MGHVNNKALSLLNNSKSPCIYVKKILSAKQTDISKISTVHHLAHHPPLYYSLHLLSLASLMTRRIWRNTLQKDSVSWVSPTASFRSAREAVTDALTWTAHSMVDDGGASAA
jgi:hypothetical protein